MNRRLIATLLLSCFALCKIGTAQNLRAVRVGFRVFETASFGNNPITIQQLMKDPAAYQREISGFSFTGLVGSGGIIIPYRQFFAGVEWARTDGSRFWKRHHLAADLFITPQMRRPIGELRRDSTVITPTIQTWSKRFVVRKRERFAGAGLGLHRRFRISNHLTFATGVHVLGSATVVHEFFPHWDSIYFAPPSTRIEQWRLLPTLKGKTLFNWQVTIPIAIEVWALRRWGFRAEANAAIIGGRFRSRDLASSETHGAGFSLRYAFQHRNAR